MATLIYGRGPNGKSIEVAVDDSGRVIISGDIAIEGGVTVDAVTIDNAPENPVPVSGPLTDTQLRAADVKVTLDGEAVVLGAGTASIGKLGANSGVDIGDVDVTSLPALPAGTNLIGKVGIDQTTPGTTDAVWVKSHGHLAAVTITRPNDTTPYSAGDALGDTSGSAIIEFANMARASGGNVMITSASMRVDLSAIPSGMAGLKLHLYNAAPTAIADNAAWDLVSGDRSKYLGFLSLGTPTDFGSTLWVESNGINKHIQLTGTSIFAVPVLDAGHTPSASTVREIRLRTIDL